MSNMVSEDLGSKKLDDMKVVELRAALEKRNLDKTGVKSILIARLKEAMAGDENNTPDEEERSEATAEETENENGNHIIGDDTAEDEQEIEEPSNTQDSEVAGEEEEETKNNGDLELNDDVVTEEKEQIIEDQVEVMEVVNKEEGIQENGHEENGISPEKEQPSEQQVEKAATEVIGEKDAEVKTDNFLQEITEESTEKQEDGEEEECNLYQDLDHEQIVYEGDEIQEEEPKQNKVSENAGNIEDAIDFMVDEDDNMLDEEMIFEDGSSNKGLSESGGTNNKEQSASKGAGRSTRGAEASRDQGASFSVEKSSSSRKSSSSHNNKSSSSTEGAHKSTSGDSKRRSDGCSLWISGLTSATKAQDLKSVLTKYGKVMTAKIVTSAKTPGSKCFGFATMSSADEASRCIKNLNKTELDGKIINVEKARGEPRSHRASAEHKSEGKSDDKTGQSKETEGKEGETVKSGDGERKEESRRSSRTSRETSSDRKRRSQDGRGSGTRGSNPRHHHRRSPPLRPGANRDNRRSPIRRRNDRDGRSLGLNQIMEERDRERMRVHQRIARDDERNDRGGGGDARQRIVERRQREEAERLQRERQQLRAERERIERQKTELLRLEREQQRIEREKLEREREELRRHQMKLQQSSILGGVSSRYSEDVRGPRGSMKRPADPGHRVGYEPDRKRPAMGSRGGVTQDRYGGDYPPPPRITPVQRNAPPPRKYDSSDRSSHRYESGGSSGGNSSHFYSRDESGGRFDRNTANSTNKISGSVGGGDNSRWMGGSSSTNISGGSRRSDDYYSDRRGSDRPTNQDSRAPRSSGVNYTSQGGSNAISGGGLSRPRGGSDRYHQGAVSAPIASTTGWRVSSSSSSGRWESRDSSSHTAVPVRGAISSSNSTAPPYATESINDFISRSVNVMPMPQGHHQGAAAMQQGETLNNRGYVLPSNSYRKY